MRTQIECILRPVPIVEKWKDIKGYEGYYQVSNFGRVKSLDRKVARNNSYMKLKGCYLKQHLGTEHYLIVDLEKEHKKHTYLVHRLVAEAFISNPNNLPHVNHIDGIKTNNDICNLEWCTRKENEKHKYLLGNGRNKKVACYDLKSNQLVEIFDSIKIAAEKKGIKGPSNIGYCCRNKRNKVGGYKWSYYEEEN